MSDTDVLETIEAWPVPAAAAAVVGTSGVLATHGDVGHRFALASVTKPLVARAAQVAVEEGAVDLDTPAGPPGSTVRHLLAHTSGLAMLDDKVLARPATRRIYSNVGFRVLAETIETATGIEFADYLTEAVLEPLGMSATTLHGGAQTAGYGATSTVTDLVRFAGDLLLPGDRVGADARRRHDRAVSGSGRGAAGLRLAAAQRLGAGLRATRRQIPALDRVRRTVRRRSAISVSRARSSGPIRSPGWRWWC